MGDAAPLSFPVKGVYGTQDDRCTLRQTRDLGSVAPDFELLGAVEGHHLFVYDESARKQWFEMVVQALDGAVSPIASGPPRARCECIARRVRPSEGCELKSPCVVGRRGGWDDRRRGGEGKREVRYGCVVVRHGTGLFPRGLVKDGSRRSCLSSAARRPVLLLLKCRLQSP